MINTDYLCRDLNLVRLKSPLVHNITNYVVMNNTANALLAIGASPVMAHAVEEVADMASIASSLVINIGTLDERWVEAMLIAGQSAKKHHVPIIFDPVGAGATSYRNDICYRIINECRPNIIRGNASEIMAICDTNVKTKGVDSNDSSDRAISSAKELASASQSIVVISGQTDYITDGSIVGSVKNGSTMMSKVTGMGCTATSIIGAFAAVNGNMFEAALHAMAVMGIAGEIATNKSAGNGSLQVNFIDELYNMGENTIKNNIRIEG